MWTLLGGMLLLQLLRVHLQKHETMQQRCKSQLLLRQPAGAGWQAACQHLNLLLPIWQVGHHML